MRPSGDPFELAETTVHGVPVRVFASAPDSLRDLLTGTARFSDREFLVFHDERWTFAEHLRTAYGLAHALRERWGVRKGDRVALAMRNYPEWVLTFWATQCLGAVCVPLNAWWTGPELRVALSDCDARVAVVDAERAERIGVDGETPLLVTRGAVPAGATAWDALDLPPDPGPPDVEIGPDDDASILYTSGTTGRHRGAVMTQRNHLTNYMTMAMLGSLGRSAGGTAPPPCTLMTYPLFHISGLMIMYTYTAFGGKLVTQYRWDRDDALEIMERERVTALTAVPTIARQIVEAPDLQRRDLSSLTSMATGAGPVPPDLMRRMNTVLGGRITATNGYGMTEATGGVALLAGPECLAEPSCVGPPLCTVDVRIAGPETGADVPDGELGEVWLRGPGVVRGYWNAPADTAESFVDGWFRTGDLGRLDDRGRVHLVDRLKDVVIRGGENVYCAEVEGELIALSDVDEVAVVGTPHRELGEEVTAVVRLVDGALSTADDLADAVRGRLAAFKIPTRFLFRDDPLPRTATGKVLKRALRTEIT